MSAHSQIAIVSARGNIRKKRNYLSGDLSQNDDMGGTQDKNGGPNHLRAWMEFRRVTGVALANAINEVDNSQVTPGMISDLANSNRALSAKWLRRIAPHLKTTPGLLLDHDPHELPEDMIDMWTKANTEQRRTLTEVTRALLRNGTEP